jgi:hypothetical protein
MRTLLVTMAVCLFATAAQAKYSGGTGMADDPYQIATAADLILLADSPTDYDRHYILTADIDLDPRLPGRRVFDKALISPNSGPYYMVAYQGFNGTPFSGTLDGSGHVISHLTIAGEDFVALFGKLGSGAVVSRLSLEAVDIHGTAGYVGALVGRNAGGSITASYSTGTVRGTRYVGGLVGENLEGSITTSYSVCTISGDWWVGGLVGYLQGGSVTQCHSSGVVQGYWFVGGLIGAKERGTVTQCLWDTQASGQTTSAGGTGEMTAEMQRASAFLAAGWDFVGEITHGTQDLWRILDGEDYPRLSWEPAPKYSGGRGTAQDPYQIATAADLILLGQSPQDYSKHFLLTADIDLDPRLPGRKVFDNAVLAPDANDASEKFEGASFVGIFNGNGHVIAHLTIVGTSNLGLFGMLQQGAEIWDLGVLDVNIVGSGNDIGSLAGCCDYSPQAAPRVLHCHGSGGVRGGREVGGLIGGNLSYVSQCHSSATVTGSEAVGGLVGSSGGDIDQCYSAGVVSGNASVGGLVGLNGKDVTNGYSTAAVQGGSEVGGLIGLNDEGAVVCCYSIGAVSGMSVGGLVGADTGHGDVHRCFWDVQTSGQAQSAGGKGLTTAQIRMAQTFLEDGWDFIGETANGMEAIWWIDEGKDYPRLSWELPARE